MMAGAVSVAGSKSADAGTLTINFLIEAPSGGFSVFGLQPDEDISGTFDIDDAGLRPDGFDDLLDVLLSFDLSAGNVTFDENDIDPASSLIEFQGDQISLLTFEIPNAIVLDFESGDGFVVLSEIVGLDVIEDRCDDCVTLTFGDVAAVPLPAALPLMGSGLGLFAFAAWRRRR